MGPRTLQRHLEESETPFNAIRDTVLREIAEAQLRSPVLSVKEIATSVGFADVAALSKAFRRWTGSSPTAFRDRPSGGRIAGRPSGSPKADGR